MPCKLSRNGLFYKVTALIDTGASITGAICPTLAHHLSKSCGAPIRKLPRAINPTGYTGKKGPIIEHALIITLTLDHRRI
jgi:hypothetical protein